MRAALVGDHPGQPRIHSLGVDGGDILELPRRIWNPATLEEHVYEPTLYETFAQAASKAAGAPRW